MCLCLATAPLSPVAVPSPVELHWACSVLWSDWLAPFVPQLLTDLSEFVDLTSPAAPASAQTQRLPPKPPPTAVSTRAASAMLVSGCADRPVRTLEASMSAACSLTGLGNLTRAAAWMDTSELRTNDPLYISVCSVSGSQLWMHRHFSLVLHSEQCKAGRFLWSQTWGGKKISCFLF